ncbi:transcriptional regulator [Candidatus Bathyarchaeota archaeon]|nr:MAG: transcriptional regulator [Candidatus Bathyarchaeota archaeon]
MRPPCETTARYLLPIFRALIAKELIERYNFTQVEVAEKLGTTQAAVSQYIQSKRGYGGINRFEESMEIIRSVTSRIARGIAEGSMDSEDVTTGLCNLCKALRGER